MYDFSKVIDRSGTNSMKWDPGVLEDMFGNPELLPLWVADMDFEVSPAVKEAVVKVAEHGIYGYSGTDKHMIAFKNWLDRRFDTKIKTEWLINTPGIVTALNIAVQTYTKPGDNVIIQRPVYYPFTDAVEKNGRHVSNNELKEVDGNYEIDFEDFEERAKDPNTTMFILCSPHNPVSRVWSKEELARLMDICVENDVLVVSDEIHNDLVMPGYEHTVTLGIDEKYQKNLISCMAPSKSFNLAGMQLSYIIIADENMRHQFNRSLEQLGLGMMSPFALEAATAAYDESEEWLDDLVEYLHGNYNYLKGYFAKELPHLKVRDLEATYLVWVDFRELGLDFEEIADTMANKAGVALDGGDWFGTAGEGFMRFNIACPRELLEQAAEQIVKAFK